MRYTRRLGWAGGFGLAATLASGVMGLGGGVGALMGSQTTVTNTVSFRHVTTTERVDLEDAAAPECDVPRSEAVLVDETQIELPEKVELRETLGPQSILIGDLDAGGTPYDVPAGSINLDELTTYETLVTLFFQSTAAGEACAVVASAARFTG